ncbi:hypothetical protein BDB00DRAFT_829835 [Zychaea mexicana]|uniref:uncharacterized protein n=1 Tax=Zychaea mexicana TaxID=64656 RepID=UPI0022FE1679|nr:uncharacterized protein BDB00DRAFT_829835 [Zychaea mexicana]KAI9492033.1 hypothetical protein BDB00DRAFT_829835 [Zychaea mexicana]
MSKRRNSTDCVHGQNKRQATNSDTTPRHFEGFYTPNDTSIEAFSSCVQQIENRDFHNAIESATVNFTNMFTNAIALLNFRAAAYGSTIQIDKGFEDAQKLMVYAPTLAVGYLRAGSLYSLRSQYKAAMTVYRQGIDALSGEQFEAERAMMQDKYDAASAKLDQRSDFTTRIPCDLIYHIMEYLPQETLAQGSSVSRTWRNYIAANRKPWMNVCLLGNEIRQVAAALPHVSHHVQIMSLLQLSSDQSDQVFLNIMDGDYTKLDTLRLYHCHFKDHFRTMIALSQVRNTLKELQFVTLAPTVPVLPLGVVLSTCKNLTKLVCHQHQIVFKAEALGGIPSMPVNKLVDLQLHFNMMGITLLEKILHCCPNVHHLDVNYCDTSIINIIRTAYPSLYSLAINDSKDAAYGIAQKAPSTQLSNDKDDQPSGVHYLVLNLNSERTVNDGPVHLLSDNASTLEALDFTFPKVSGAAVQGHETILARWDPLFANNISFGNLRSLTISFGPLLTGTVTAILLRSPVLETLEFNSCSFLDITIFQTVPQLECIEELAICDVSGLIEDGMISMFRAFAQKEDMCSLQLVKLADNNWEINQAILESLASVRLLETIYLDSLVIHPTIFEAFARALADDQDPSCIQTMSLYNIDDIGDEALRYISKIQSLRDLCLMGLPNITDGGLKYIRSNKSIDLELP